MQVIHKLKLVYLATALQITRTFALRTLTHLVHTGLDVARPTSSRDFRFRSRLRSADKYRHQLPQTMPKSAEEVSVMLPIGLEHCREVPITRVL